jgi:hypothetical protein
MGKGAAQTPGLWVKGGGSGQFSDKCKKALKACGVDPDSFGSYSDRRKAQAKLRKQGKGKDVTADKMTGQRAQDYLTANSQSGHMAQNAWFQRPGGRDDACMNVPPANGKNNAGSSFGYTCAGAPCTDHFGKSNIPGTCHGNVSCKVEHDSFCKGGGGSRAGIGDIEKQVKASSKEHVDANRDTKSAKPADQKKIDKLKNAQRATADHLQGKSTTGKTTGKAAAAKGKKPNGPSGPGPSQKTKDLAAKCEVARWKAMMAEMRAQAINDSEVGQVAEAKFGKPFTKCSAKERKEALADVQKKNGTPLSPPNPPKGSGIPNPPETKPRGKDREPPDKKSAKPTTGDCLEYQKNYLAMQMANSGSMPPWEGECPPSGGSTASGGKKSGKKKSK